MTIIIKSKSQIDSLTTSFFNYKAMKFDTETEAAIVNFSKGYRQSKATFIDMIDCVDFERKGEEAVAEATEYLQDNTMFKVFFADGKHRAEVVGISSIGLLCDNCC